MRRVVHTLRAGVFVTLGASFAACSAIAPGPAVPEAGAAARAHLATSSGALLYIGAHHFIETYSYPSGTSASRMHTKFFVVALCSDVHGNVFMPATLAQSGKTSGEVVEYAHGGSQPLRTVALPKGQLPVDCSSDPSTGNLAVTSYDVRNFAPQINVYVNGSGTPHAYKAPALGASSEPAYDNSGDLYVTSGGNVGVFLAAGSSTLVKITSNTILGPVAHAQWDGKYFALQSFTVARHQGEHTQERIFRFSISGSTATLQGYSHFTGWYAHDPGRSWIDGNTMVATPGAYIAIWNYPAGGKSVKVVHPGKAAKSVTVSAAS